jgi:uncharacterized protein
MSRCAWVSLAACVSYLSAAQAMDKMLDLRAPMRDGIRLSTNVFHPPGKGRYPTILIRTPYNKGSDLPSGCGDFIQRGYAVVVQDVRGRYGSEGVFEPLDQEGPDGYDTLNWIARQPWSDGNVGMTGGSYVGIAQWKAAVTGNPHLKAIFPVVSGDDDYLDRFYSPGGAMKLGHRLLWFSWNFASPGFRAPPFAAITTSLPLRTADLVATGRTVDAWQKALNHPSYDDFWKRLSIREHMDRVRVPVFSAGGWYDNYVDSDLDGFTALDRVPGHPEHHIVIGPWAHNIASKFGAIDFGPTASSPLRAYELAWFDRWLKGPADPPPTGSQSPPVNIFVMGLNRWRDEREWPLARTRYTKVYLDSTGHANGLDGDGALDWKPAQGPDPDHFTYDPRKPVPTLGGAICCSATIFPWGPIDQRPVEKRRDVLVYTSAALTRELEVTGSVRVILYASTSAPDTDFTAKLVDLFPSGEARNLCDGILRMRYREGLDRTLLASGSEIYALTIPAGVTSNVFLPGHRIRLEISSSNFPRFDRNPNTGRPVADESTIRTADQTIYHGRQFPSHLLLPVVK